MSRKSPKIHRALEWLIKSLKLFPLQGPAMALVMVRAVDMVAHMGVAAVGAGVEDEKLLFPRPPDPQREPKPGVADRNGINSVTRN